MTRRGVLLCVAVLAGALSAALYHASAQRTGVLVIARALDGAQPLTASDVELRGLPLDAVPEGALRDPADAIGRYTRGPLSAGQLLVRSALADDATIFATGLLPPTGMRAMAVPVTAAHAVGGALQPGVRVDVIAVPLEGRAPPARGLELVASRAVVLDVRGESGLPVARQQRGALAPDRLASIVIAVAPSEELRLAERIPTSTFVIALASR